MALCTSTLLLIKSDCSTNLCLFLSRLKQGGKENDINPKGIKVMLLSFDNTGKQAACHSGFIGIHCNKHTS